MIKRFTAIIAFACSIPVVMNAQCTYEDLFPYSWGTSAFEVNEHFQSDPRFEIASDTIRASAFQHHQDYFRMVRNMNLSFYGYKSVNYHDCLKSGNITLVCIANDSGLVAYSYMIDYPAEERDNYNQVLDSLKSMMQGKFVYSSNVKNKLQAGNMSGDGISIYFDEQPIIPDNLKIAPMAIRVGSLSEAPEGSEASNRAGPIKFYRLEILYKKSIQKW